MNTETKQPFPKCPNCNGETEVGENGTFDCFFCGNTFKPDALESANSTIHMLTGQLQASRRHVDELKTTQNTLLNACKGAREVLENLTGETAPMGLKAVLEALDATIAQCEGGSK